MEEEVRHLAGERHEQHPRAARPPLGKEAGYCVVAGEGAIQRTRLRNQEHREQRLGPVTSYSSAETRWNTGVGQVMRGLSRATMSVVKDFHQPTGEKSAVSDNFSPPAESCRR